ncbi:unnamed protein product [Paramecium sonneborni]|uniref:ubiquitinyl hydrolase 1 n=1 Tax=Paramecium sonneborni TaxID=65129 RepID=A0A8S1JYI2_9CILI|nr:unnamed protein product [Paramecium sonneborni]
MKDEKLNGNQMSQQTAEQLKKQVFEYKKLQESFSKRFQQDSNIQFYILSTKWLNQWKKYVSYDEIVANKAPSMQFGRIKLDRINDDLKDFVNQSFKYHPNENHPWNTFMKQSLQENVDYVVIDKEIWDLFQSYHQNCLEIIRTSNGNGKDKQVSVNLLRFKCVFLDPSLIDQISSGKKFKQTIDIEFMQVDRKMKLKDYYGLLQTTINTFQGSFEKGSNSVKLWRYVTDQQDPFKTLYNEIYKEFSSEYINQDMCFYLNAELLTHDKYEYIEDIGIIDNNIILFEFKYGNRLWCVSSQPVSKDKQKIQNQNSNSNQNYNQNYNYNYNQYESLTYEKSCSDDETVKSLTLTQKSIKGIVGLSNLGNTCFMNSGTQCISNSYPLVEYFLKNLYFDEINMDNPLGTKGQLVKKVGSLIKKMWCGDKQTITPINYKKAVGQFQPMFSGYDQHDSSELITFVLDGIHEDLNRVKKKPYIETQAYDGRPDFIVAKESWLNHLARNQSIIVDLMHGQYKSTLQCPTCKQVSITFDPYLIVQLGIPTYKKRTITFKYYKDFFQSSFITIPFDKNKKLPLKEYLKHLGVILKVDSQHLFGYIRTYDSYYDFFDENKSIIDIRKSSKRSQLCFRKLTQEEILMKKKIPIKFSNKYYEGSSSISFDQAGVFILDIQMTLKQVHLLIFSNFQQFFTGYNTLNYKNQVLNQYYTLLYKTNQNYWNSCAFCNSQSCQDCEIKFDDETVEQVVNKALKIDKNINFEIIILWKQSPFKQVRLLDIFNYFVKQYKIEDENNNLTNQFSSSTNYNSSSNTVTLYDCLQYSQIPEQLNPDNTWYCKVCQEHVQAFKSMQIYKAPQILIFTLKRFKTSNIQFKQKLETFVDFPIENLDMTDYLINSNTPKEFHKENMTNNGEINKKQVIYDLYAISNHFGGIGGGHYTAFAKNKFTNKWYDFDDSSVSQISESMVVSKSAYVLCYQLRTNFQEITKQKLKE